MKVDVEFYQHWERWLVAKAHALLTGDDPTRILDFVSDVSNVTAAFRKAVQAIPTSFPAILGYAFSHPDPLRPVRWAIYAMQKKWGE